MKTQIQDLLAFYQVSAAEFAKIIGVNPSGLSHIIGGKRNYLSTDTIIKIKDKYPDISLDWLILGKGEMIKGGPAVTSLFSNDTDELNSQNDAFKGHENPIIHSESKITHENSLEKSQSVDKAIKKIIILNSDNTFDEFYPNSK